MTFNIRELKKHLGPGLGLRKNKYLLELPIPTVEGQTINLLCRSAGLPERNIHVTQVWHKGRSYNMRGETDYIGEYEISIVDDSDMRIRKMFDIWLTQIDNTKPANEGIIGASFEKSMPGFLSEVSSFVKTANQVKNLIKNPKQALDWVIGSIAGNNASTSQPNYQTDINIWQLGNNGEKVYGYKLQNAFPKSVGIVTLDDSDENTLSEFSVVFAFSEYIPLENTRTALTNAILGDTGTGILNSTNELFD
jgi:hypothetical protein